MKMPQLTAYTKCYLDKSCEWLNDPEIKALTLTPDFTREDQQRFFESLSARTNYWVMGIAEDNLPVGAMGLKNITASSAEYWGYIGEKEYWGKGIGNFMLQQAKEKAAALGLKQIFLYVAATNERAKSLYRKHGFTKVEDGSIEKYSLNV